jgi:hypothetical protein
MPCTSCLPATIRRASWNPRPHRHNMRVQEGGREYMRAVRHSQIGHCLKGMLFLVDSAPESYLHLPNKSLLRPHCIDLSNSIHILSFAFLFFSFVLFSPPPALRPAGRLYCGVCLSPLAVIGQWDKIIPNSCPYRI